MYHRVAEPRDDPFALAVPPAWFAEHLDLLASRCRLVALDALLGTDPDPSAADRVSITFDDGYRDNLTAASPALLERRIPATFFVSTGCLGDPRGFWWDRVGSAIAATDSAPCTLELPAGRATIDDVADPRARSDATVALAAQLRPLPADLRDRSVAAIEEQLRVRPGADREQHPVLDDAGVRALAAQPLTTLGAHTRRHPVLAGLSRDEQRNEIAASADTLRDLTGTRPVFAAYPYGGVGEYDDESPHAAAEAGMAAAFVNHGGHFDPAREPFRIPRYYVPPLPAPAFATWLDELVRR